MSVTSVNGQTGVAVVDLQNAFDAGPSTISVNASSLAITDSSAGSQDGVVITTDSTGVALNLAKSGTGSVLSISNDVMMNHDKPLIAVSNAAFYGPTIAAADNTLDDNLPGGTLTFKAGNKSTGVGFGGFVALIAGSSEDDQGGGIHLVAGSSNADAAPGGIVGIIAGDGTNAGGSVSMNAGSSSAGVGGSVEIRSGEGVSSSGNIMLNSPGALTFKGNYIDRATYSDPGFVRDQYISSITLLGSTTAVASQLTFDSAVFGGIIISYRIADSVTDESRVGTLMVTTNGTTASVLDTYAETASLGVTWAAALTGTEVRISYTASANNKEMRADVKSFQI